MKGLLLLLGAAAWLAWPVQERDGAELLTEADRAFFEATRERGLEGWLEWFAPDAVVLTADGRIVSGADELRTYYASLGFPPAGFAWTPERGELAASGELGYTLGSWELRPPGAPADADLPSGRYLTFWRRQPDGSFRVVADSGGEPSFRTRVSELEGPPLAWSCDTERIETAASGELALALGAWSARSAEAEREGKFLTAWKRTEDGAWVVAAEIGFDH
jgi:ketosteroid isomerase-like protein